MPRLYLFAEGLTEQTFADQILKPRLAEFAVNLTNNLLIASGRKKGKTSRGGGRNYLAMKKDIQRCLAQEKAADVFFTTMIDLYSISHEFPGLAEAEKLRHMPETRVDLLERSFAADIGDQRFVPYIQLHEFEAYLFCDPTCFRLFYDHHDRELKALSAIADKDGPPEQIDDGQHSAPSKRIIAEIPDYEFAKAVVGPQIAALIGLETIRAQCPHFARVPSLPATESRGVLRGARAFLLLSP